MARFRLLDLKRLSALIRLCFLCLFSRSFALFFFLSWVGSLLLFAVSPAQAACSNNTPPANTNVVCTGVDNAGVTPTGNNVTVTVQSGASVNSSVSGAGTGVVSLLGASSVTNAGIISGTGSHADGVILDGPGPGTVTNGPTGSIVTSGPLSVAVGVQGAVDNAVINNSGLIQASGSFSAIDSTGHVPVSGNITIINNATGKIINTSGGMYGAIFMDANGSLELDNYGSIQSPGAANTITLESPMNTVLLGTSSTISGNVVPQAGGNNTLILGGTGTASFQIGDVGPGQQYQNFTQMVKNNTSIWTVTGANTLPWTVNQGTLNVASGASIGGTVAINGGVVDLNAGDSTIAGNVTLGSAGMLTGIGVVMGNTNNNGGTIAPGMQVPNPTPASLGSLTVQGNYTGSPSSKLVLGTILNSGGPLSNQITDRLLIAGNATGNTSVNVNPIAVGGAPTGFPNTASTGISIVQVGGVSSPNAFTLPHGYITGGSPFEYHLNAYGPGSPNGPSDPSQEILNSPSFWDFRLQNAYEVGGPPSVPGQPPPTVRLTTAPQVPTYLTVGLGLASSQVDDLSELHRRLGEIRVDNQTAVHKPDEVFIRAYGSKLQYKTDQDYSNYGFNFSDYYAATQIGANHMLVDNSQGKLRAGLAGVVGHTWVKPSEAVKSKGSVNSQSVAALLTWESREEWYVDAILSGGLFSGPVTPEGRSSVTTLSGDTLAGSVEVGYPYDIGWNHIIVEPEVQMIYGRLKFSSVMDLDTIPVDLGKQTQRTLRLGARVFRVLASRPNMHLTSYAEGNITEDLTGTHHVVIGNVPFTTGSFGDTIQLRGGVNGNISQRFSVYSDLAWQFRVSTSGFLGWAFNLGLRYTF